MRPPLGRLSSGDRAFVFYSAGQASEPWHERLLLRKVRCSLDHPSPEELWVVATPDGDLYEEELGPSGCTGLMRAGVQGGVPTMLRARGEHLHRFENGSWPSTAHSG